MANLPPIAVFIGFFPKISETWFVEQITSLIDLGVDVRLFAFNRGLPIDISKKVRDYRLMEKVTYLDFPQSRLRRFARVPFLVLKLLFNKPSALRKVFAPGFGHTPSFKYLFWTAPLVGRVEECAVVHCHFGMIANKYLVIKEILGLPQPLVATFHGQDSSKFIQQKGPQVYDQLKKEISLLLPVTNEMRDRLVRFGFSPDRARVSFMSGIVVNEIRFEERKYLPEEKFKIIFVGRFVEKKGVPDLLRALALVVKKHPNVEAHIFGGGDDVELNKEIERIVIDEGLAGNVIFYGMRPNDEVRVALYGAHLSVQLSKTAKNGDTDDLPVAILEAQATGLPTLTTRHVGIPDGVEDGSTGFLVPEGDYVAASEKILYYIEHPDIIPRMSRCARKFMEDKFDLIAIDKELIGYYKQLISSGKVI